MNQVPQPAAPSTSGTSLPQQTPLLNRTPTVQLSLDSADLFQGRREVTIRHGTETYRLRLTKSGKLILHK